MLICAHIGFGLGAVYTVMAALSMSGNPLFTGFTGFTPTLTTDAVVAVCSLLPDVVDKLLWIFRVTKGSRTYGHTLIFVGGMSALGSLLGPQTAGLVGLAVLSHLVADRTCGHVPFLWPLQPFRLKSMTHTPATHRAIRACEVLGVLFVMVSTGLPARLGPILCTTSLVGCLALSLTLHRYYPFKAFSAAYVKKALMGEVDWRVSDSASEQSFNQRRRRLDSPPPSAR
eukprot:m.136584 g.136584  ORF g.136584 m.136584 type:complete len:228 (+) comp22634_c0_seq1:104-787(+)